MTGDDGNGTGHRDGATGRWFDTGGPLVDGEGVTGTIRRWVLLDGNRWALAALLAGFLFALLLVVGVADGSFQASASADDPIETVFSALVTGIVTITEQTLTTGEFVLREDGLPRE